MVVLALVCGCQGPAEGPGSGWIEVDGERSEIVSCEWREDALDPEAPIGRRIFAETADGRGVFVSDRETGIVVQRTVPGGSTSCEVGTFADAAGAWRVEATCAGRTVVAEIGSCAFLDHGE